MLCFIVTLWLKGGILGNNALLTGDSPMHAELTANANIELITPAFIEDKE